MPIAAIVALASGCAGAPHAAIEGTQKAVQVYDMDPYLGKGYEIVGRLWTDSPRSRLRIPTFPTRDAAISAMQSEAASLNADALISVSCVDQRGSTWSAGSEPAFLCYGVAIRLRQGQG